ncbi:MAG: Rieske 2Fe-2S domain-containing protein [Nodularia sp. CChRGM 3473]
MVTQIETTKAPLSFSSPTIFEKRGTKLAASWYIAMHSKLLTKKPKAIELFGRTLVAWRDKTDKPVIMERYCSHMGMSLAQGEIVDGCIRCPFHHWQYDNSGQCVSIPTGGHIPPKARQTVYPTTERYGYIWVWYGCEIPLFPLPEFPAAENKREYMLYRFYDGTKATVRQIIENTFDYAHFGAIHKLKGSGTAKYTLHEGQHPAKASEPPIQEGARFGAEFECSGLDVDPTSKIFGFHPDSITLLVDGWPSGQRITVFLDGKETYKVLLATSPISETYTIQEILLMVKKTGKFWLDPFYYILFCLHNRFGTFQDLPLYDYSSLDAGGVHVKDDFGVLKFRSFYQNWANLNEF